MLNLPPQLPPRGPLVTPRERQFRRPHPLHDRLLLLAKLPAQQLLMGDRPRRPIHQPAERRLHLPHRLPEHLLGILAVMEHVVQVRREKITHSFDQFHIMFSFNETGEVHGHRTNRQGRQGSA